MSVDIMKSLPNASNTKPQNYFTKKWTKNLENQGKQQQILSMKKDVAFLSKNLNRPLAILKLINHFVEEKEEKEPVPHIFQPQGQIPLYFIYVLQGQDNDFFSWSPKKQRFLLTKQIQPTLNSLAKMTSDIGSMVLIIKDYIEKRHSLVQRQISFVLQDILQKHLFFVSSLEAMYSTISPSQMIFLLHSKPVEELKAAAIIANTIQNHEGGELANMFLFIEEHGDATLKDVSRRCRGQSMKAIERMCIDWSLKGRVDDPYNEFFIQAKATAETPEEWWNDMFNIDEIEVPKGMNRETVMDIYSAGKCLNFVRKWDHTVELDIKNDNFAALVKEASEAANKQMLMLFMDQEHLMQKLIDLMDYVLLRRGDFASTLLAEGAKADKRINFILNYFSHRTIEGIKYMQFGIDGPELSYTPKGITSVLFNQEFTTAYRTVSSLLLKIKKAEFALAMNKKICKNKKQSTLIFEMFAFVNAITHYFNFGIRSRCEQLIEKINEASDFDSVVKAFQTHVKDLIRTCWLTSDFRNARTSLFNALSSVEEATMNEETVDDNRIVFYGALKSFGICLIHENGDAKILGRQLAHLYPLVF